MFKYVLVLLGILFLLLQYELWLAPDGVKETVHLQQVLKALKHTQAGVSDQNKALQTSVDHAESVEGRARSELGMVKQGETFYQVVPDVSTKK